jgi:hypothetical protein
MGGACSTYGERSVVYRVWAGIHEGARNLLDDPGVNGRIILKWIFRKWDGGMDRTDLAQDTERRGGTCKC